MCGLIRQLHSHRQLVCGQRIGIQSGADVVQQSREDEREWLELAEGMFELDGIGKNWRRVFDLQVPLGFAGSELLEFDSRLSQTLRHTGNGKRGEISKGANAPESQCLHHFFSNFFLDVDERVIEPIDRKLSQAS